jgi:protein-tyrosine kinase
MSIIEQATKRLEELSRAGVAVPWGAAGLAQGPHRVPGSAAAAQATDPTIGAAEIHLVDTAHASLPGAAARSAEPRARSPARMVTLDLPRLEREGHIVATHSRSMLSEEFRQIKRPLLKHTRSKETIKHRLALIMITSAMPGEGKTFSAINLAMSIANEIDKSVLLVDADVVRPELMRRLGVEADAGLLDLLTDPSLSLDDVVLETNVPKLSLLPAGKRNNYSTELLASEAMEKLLLSLAADCPGRIVLFDAPPLLVTAEAKVLAARVGQVVLVVEASGTHRREVERAFAAVEQCPNVSAILNKAHEPETPGGYGYYYG